MTDQSTTTNEIKPVVSYNIDAILSGQKNPELRPLCQNIAKSLQASDITSSGLPAKITAVDNFFSASENKVFFGSPLVQWNISTAGKLKENKKSLTGLQMAELFSGLKLVVDSWADVYEMINPPVETKPAENNPFAAYASLDDNQVKSFIPDKNLVKEILKYRHPESEVVAQKA